MLTPEQKIDRIAQALKTGGGTISVPEVMAGLHEGRFQIFDNEHGVCVSRICEGNGVRFLDCFVVAGELPGVMDLQPQVLAFAEAHGCQWMETTARLGWEKVLPDFGWKKARVVFVREVGNG